MYFCLYWTSTTTLAMVFTTEYRQRHSAVHGGTQFLWAVQSTALTNEPIFWIRKALYATSNVVRGWCKLTMVNPPSSNTISNRLVRLQVVLCRRHHNCARPGCTSTSEKQQDVNRRHILAIVQHLWRLHKRRCLQWSAVTNRAASVQVGYKAVRANFQKHAPTVYPTPIHT